MSLQTDRAAFQSNQWVKASIDDPKKLLLPSLFRSANVLRKITKGRSIMEVKDLKWYSPFLFLLGVILSFADPITDILTLVEFYRTGNKIWFGVGLAFVILPCLLFPLLYCVVRIDWEEESSASCCTKGILCGFHPFAAAVARIEGFIFCYKKWYRGGEIDSDSVENANVVLNHIRLTVLFEAFFESLPQFVIQLYVMSVQEDRIAIIQMISLPVSFLSLAWTATTADDMLLNGRDIITLEHASDPSVKHRLVLLFLKLFYLSSQLVAISFFTVGYKWWVIGVLLFIAIQRGTFFFVRAYKPKSLSLKLASYAFFLLINFFMILMYYFSEQAKNWYSLPITVCVCVISVVYVIMTVALNHWVRRRANAVNPQVENN